MAARVRAGAVDALGPIASHWSYVSSVAVYADQSVGGDESQPIVDPLEGDVVDPEFYGPAKVACERTVQTLSHTLIARAGLLGGAGDRSDRSGYWVSRFALAGDEPVLVPDATDQPVQVLDARDLDHEKSLGLERERRAGLTREAELDLIRQLRS